jgi:hypothetical protein
MPYVHILMRQKQNKNPNNKKRKKKKKPRKGVVVNQKIPTYLLKLYKNMIWCGLMSSIHLTSSDID